MTMKRLLSLTLALALGISLLAGCSQGSGSGPGSSSSAPDGSSSAAPSIESMDLSQVTDPYLATAGIAGDTVMAKAGEYDIPASELLYWLNYGVELFLSQTGGAYDAPVDWDMSMGEETLKDYLANSALETAAFYRLLPEMGAREALEVSQEDLDYLEQDLASGLEQMGSEELFNYVLWYQLRTREGYSNAYKAGAMYQQLQEHWYGEGSEGYPTDAEVRSYIDQQGYYRVKHILLSNKGEDGSTPLDEAAVREKKATADGLLAQLRAAEDPVVLFDELMNRYSEDPGLAAYPDGYESYPGQMVPEFEEASLALKDGEISEVVESGHGYHIILRLPLDLEKFREELISVRMQERADGWLEEYPIRTTDAWDALDFDAFRTNVLSLQAAVQAAVQAQQAADGSSPGGQG